MKRVMCGIGMLLLAPSVLAALHVVILEPADGVTLRHNHHPLRVVVKVKPELPQSARVQLIYDEVPVDSPQLTTAFELQNVYRGQHTLRAQVVGEAGQVLAQSPSITFYMHPPRVRMLPGTKPRTTP